MTKRNYYVHIMKLKSYNRVYHYYLQANLHLLLKTEKLH